MKPQLQPIDTAPKDGRYILLAGPSGYCGTPLRFESGRWAEDRKSAHRAAPWMTHSGDDFTDGGEPPTHWMGLPEVAPAGITNPDDPFES